MIALIVTPEGFPLSYEVLAGNTKDSNTLSDFLKRIETRYGRAKRIWIMDRGIPTEQSLEQMRAMGASYLVGTPKGRLTKLEKAFLSQPWQRVCEGVEVKRLAQGEDTYVLAQSAKRINKERAMRRRRLGRYVARLQALQRQTLTRDELLMKVGAAKKDAGRAAGVIKLHLPDKEAAVTAETFRFSLDRAKLRKVRRREGRYLLRTNGLGQPLSPDTIRINCGRSTCSLPKWSKPSKSSNTISPCVRFTLSSSRVSKRTSSSPFWPIACR